MKIIEDYNKLPNNFFKLIFWNVFFAYLIIFFVSGLLALFQIRPITFNDEPTYGILGFLISMIMAPMISFVSAVAIWILLMMGNIIMKMVLKFKR